MKIERMLGGSYLIKFGSKKRELILFEKFKKHISVNNKLHFAGAEVKEECIRFTFQITKEIEASFVIYLSKREKHLDMAHIWLNAMKKASCNPTIIAITEYGVSEGSKVRSIEIGLLRCEDCNAWIYAYEGKCVTCLETSSE